ncbi:MAG TPA: carboxylating nicotinate-nucleotide diphosphorylase [Bacteroidales bacterium]|nr:carboxylating nicotinate-nucleotide diphosphorylase [Bacteroidales bacterium]
MTKALLQEFIDHALNEDLGDGDHSSLACIPDTAAGKARLLVKESGVLAGMEIAPLVFHTLQADLQFTPFLKDGDLIKPGDIAFTVEGKTRTLLQAERLVLNIMQRMSGIATRTREYATRIADLKTKVLDTRKTTPGMRWLEKEAVRIGGGVNHRMGLYDMIMLKDNHIDFAGGIEKAIKATQAYLKKSGRSLKIEIEVRNMDELEQVMQTGGVDRILIDNFSPELTQQAVARIAGRYETESSGGITLERLRDYALTGVDYISVGALTHHIKSLDLSLKAY